MFCKHKNNDQKWKRQANSWFWPNGLTPQQSVISCRCFLPGPLVSHKVTCWQVADGKASGPLTMMTARSDCQFSPSGRQTELYLAPILECSTLLGARSWWVPHPSTGLRKLHSPKLRCGINWRKSRTGFIILTPWCWTHQLQAFWVSKVKLWKKIKPACFTYLRLPQSFEGF